MRYLKQSTSVDVPIGPFLDEVDARTPETALTITQPDIRLKKNSAGWAQKNAAQTLSHEENGFYEVTLDATDTGTLGLLRLAVFESGALPVWEDFMVVTANVYDSLFSTDVLDVSVTQVNGTTAPNLVGGRFDASVGAMAAGVITAAAHAAGAIDAAAIAADAIGASELATDAANEIADALLDRANAIETGLTLRQALRLIAAADAAKLSGAATATVVIRNAVADSKDRITATVDADGNRSAITYDLT